VRICRCQCTCMQRRAVRLRLVRNDCGMVCEDSQIYSVSASDALMPMSAPSIPCMSLRCLA
jgi:hypothetical protein